MSFLPIKFYFLGKEPSFTLTISQVHSGDLRAQHYMVYTYGRGDDHFDNILLAVNGRITIV